MSDKKPDILMSTFAGFVITAGIGLVAMPICVFLNVPPAYWGSLTIGAMPIGALLGWAWARVQHGDDTPHEPKDPWEGRTYRPRRTISPNPTGGE